MLYYFKDSDSSDEESERKNDKSSNGFQHDGEPIFLQKKMASKTSLNEKIEAHHVGQEDEVDLRSEEEKREDAVSWTSLNSSFFRLSNLYTLFVSNTLQE